MSQPDEFDAVRSDPDPLRRAKRAGELIAVYQQRSAELARLRRAAIEEARDARGLNYTEIADQLGITKGRITQIRTTAPPPERAFFGVGPVSVGVPLRFGTDDRMRTYVDASDLLAQEQTEGLLNGLSLTAQRFPIRPELDHPPPGDAVVICGPKSAPVGANLLSRDERLAVTKIGGRWWIEDRETGERYGSPRSDEPPLNADLGYFARHKIDGSAVLHVAGITAIGSSGVLHYLANHVAELWSKLGDTEFSLIVRCEYADDITITGSALLAGPYEW
jgi:transcriptional regulator with XRE-family HTH domain